MYEKFITVEVDDERKVIETFRVDGDGNKIILTQYPFDRAADAGFDAFARQLGEDLIFFSVKLAAVVKP